MKTWTQTLVLTQPLKGARAVAAGAETDREGLEARLRARYEEGVRDGEKALRQQLVQQRAELVELQNGVLQSLRQALPGVRSECESTLIDLALEISHKLVAGLPLTREMVETAVRDALDHLEDAHDIVVRLHAEDLELLRRVNSPLLLAAVGGEKVRFEAAPEVTRGGCLVQTRFGTLDARRETKLDVLRKSLEP